MFEVQLMAPFWHKDVLILMKLRLFLRTSVAKHESFTGCIGGFDLTQIFLVLRKVLKQT